MAKKKAKKATPGAKKPPLIYKVKGGAHITKKALKDLAPIVHRLVKTNKGPADFLRLATNPTSPAHKHFEWDDSKAAHKHRLYQARYYMRSIEVEVTSIGEDVRVSCSIRQGELDGKNNTWYDIHTIKNSKNLMAQLLKQATDDLRSFRHRYAVLNKVAAIRPIFIAINKFLTTK
jgi:hypothetical protein